MAHQWRGVIREYAERLPVTEATKVITLGEGGTPLVHAQQLSALTGSEVYLKVEGMNPTGSFKDRGMTMAMTAAVAAGAKAVVCASTGNTSASAAAYATAAGLTCVVLVPEGKVAPSTLSSTSWSSILPFGSVVAIVALGQMLVIMMGGIDLSMAASISLLANVLVGMGLDDEARTSLEKAATLDPQFWLAWWSLALHHVAHDRPGEALASAERALSIAQHPVTIGLVAGLLHRAGATARSEALLQPIDADSTGRLPAMTGFYFACGDFDQSVAWAVKALDQGFAMLPIMFVFPFERVVEMVRRSEILDAMTAVAVLHMALRVASERRGRT